MRCCCGRPDCALLRQNCSVLESVEKDVHTAAELGQALLARHEAYMATAEKERLELATRVSQLEVDKKELGLENARTIEENRTLLDQLEMLNTAVSDSESRIRALEATLLSSQQAVRRLEGAANRAADMERHLSILEQEQLRLENQLVTSEAETKSTLLRWRKAERGIVELQDQLERMEREAQEEREKHAEIMERMHRRREVERNPDSAAVRLKGTVATNQVMQAKQNSVVSHLVHDLLQDNANLQLGIAELREMLMNSNDEIQALREQLLYHQPVLAEAGESGPGSTVSTLCAELEKLDEGSGDGLDAQANSDRSQSVSQELHIHHHYHVSSKREPRKPKKKRSSLTQSILTPPPPQHLASPRSPSLRFSHGRPLSFCSSYSSTPAPPLVSRLPSHRWSVISDQPSEFAPSSTTSSPQSHYRNSIFDRGGVPGVPMDADVASSPTTSIDPLSPSWRASRHKGPPDASMKGLSISPSFVLSQKRLVSATIVEEGTPGGIFDTRVATETGTTAVASLTHICQPKLRRVSSRESIMSLAGGLVIHTLQTRPGQLALKPQGAAHAIVTGVTARPTISGASKDQSGEAVLRGNLSLLPVAAQEGPKVAASGLRLAKLVTWRPWKGMARTTADGSLNTPATSPSATAQSSVSLPNSEPEPSPFPDLPTPSALLHEAYVDLARPTGINQVGAIPGFQEFLARHARRGPPAKVQPDVVDREALREVLESFEVFVPHLQP